MKKIIYAVLGGLMLFAAASYASHSWSTYHWARTTASFDLIVVDSTTAKWQNYVTQAIADWTASTELNMIENDGDTSRGTRKRCVGDAGQLRICNDSYGQTGWLGVAGISLDSDSHITTGYTKMNDTYFDQDFYNTFEWRQAVTCQELGHNLGLNHQDEDFNNVSLFTCMDYQAEPYPYPNDHDYEQLGTIYTHTDAYNSYDDGSGSGGGCNPAGRACNSTAPADSNGDVGWGISLGRSGNAETFIRVDANGIRHLTHVTWAIGY